MAFPEVCVIDKQSCPNEWPILYFNQFAKGSQTIFLHDSVGKPMDLTALEITKVCFLAKASYGKLPMYVDKPMAIVDPEEGEVRLDLSDTETYDAGMFLGEVVLYNGEDGSSSSGSSFGGDTFVPCQRLPAYLYVTESLSDNHSGNSGLSIAEVRMVIMDRCPEDNFLLDNVEFSDSQIASAIRRPIDLWNETNPMMRHYVYTAANFPWRYHWVEGTVAELLRAAALNYKRNRLRYSASGLSVDDKDKGDEYSKAAKEYADIYKAWVLQTKYALNMGQAWGVTWIPVFGSVMGAGSGGGSIGSNPGGVQL